MSTGVAQSGLMPPGNVGNVNSGIPSPFGGVPDTKSPYPGQEGGPEKCNRMMDVWLYKCAVAPL